MDDTMKKRLVGAVVLVALAVIFVPMLLEEKHSHEFSTGLLTSAGSLGLLTDLVNEHGADSMYAKIGATMFGSSETTFYVIAVYFGSVGVMRSRHAIPAGLIADAVGALTAVYVCRLLLG